MATVREIMRSMTTPGTGTLVVVLTVGLLLQGTGLPAVADARYPILPAGEAPFDEQGDGAVPSGAWLAPGGDLLLAEGFISTYTTTYNPDGSQANTTSSESVLATFDPVSLELLNKRSGQGTPRNVVGFSPDGTSFYAHTGEYGAEQRLARVDARTFEVLAEVTVGSRSGWEVLPTGLAEMREGRLQRRNAETLEVEAVGTDALPTSSYYRWDRGNRADETAFLLSWDPDNLGVPVQIWKIDTLTMDATKVVDLDLPVEENDLESRQRYEQFEFAVHPDEQVAYLVHSNYVQHLLKVDLGSGELKGRVSFGQFNNVPAWPTWVVDPDYEFAFLTESPGGSEQGATTAKFDLDTMELTARHDTRPLDFGDRLAASQDGRYVYVAAGTQGVNVGELRLLRFEVDDRPDPKGVDRFSGSNRYETATDVATASWPDGADVVYLATGLGFADALAGGPLAAVDNAPILLTSPGELPESSRQALVTLSPTRVIALGGTNSVYDQVLQRAAAQSGAVPSRLSGPNRFATAEAIAQQLPPTDTVFLATGLGFADALAASPATAGAPILLVSDSLPLETARELARRKPSTVIAVGGPKVVTNQVLEAAARAAGGATTRRVSGPNRFATAVAAAQLVERPTTVFVSTGFNFPDALGGAPAAARVGAPLVLTETSSLSAETKAFLQALEGLECIVILGGRNSVSTNVAHELAQLAAGCPAN